MGKYLLKPFLLTTGVCLLLTFSGCKDDYDDPTAMDEEEVMEQPTPLPYDDQLTEKVAVPTAVIGNDFDPVTTALINRLNLIANEIGDDVKAVIIDGALIPSLTNAQKNEIQAVFDRGGSIILSEANPQTAYDFSKNLGEEPSFNAEDESGNDHFCDVYVFNNHNDEYIVQDIHAKIKGVAISDDDVESGEITSGPVNILDDLTPYQYGLRADKLAIWINRNSEPHKTKARSDINGISSAQVVAIDYYPTFYDHDKAKNLSGSYTVVYMITSLYSFAQDADYYAVHQEVIGSNQAMYLGNWKDGDNYCYGFYLGVLINDNCLLTNENTVPNSARIQTTSPATTENARQESVSLGFSIGGDVGMDSSGPSAGISAGINYSESYNVTIPDVSIANQCKSDDSHLNATWEYDVAAPSPKTNFWGYIKGFNNAPSVSINTIDIHNTWLWVVNNPSGKYKMECKNTIMYEYIYGWNNTFSIGWVPVTKGYNYYRDIVLNPPKRTRD